MKTMIVILKYRQSRLRRSKGTSAPTRPEKQEPPSKAPSDFYHPDKLPHPRKIRLPERRYPGEGAEGHGIPLLLQKHEEQNWKAPPPSRIKEKVAAKESRREQFMTNERKQKEKRHRKTMDKILSDPLVGPLEKRILFEQPNISRSPHDEFEYQESMATSSSESEHDEPPDPTDAEKFKSLHTALQAQIIVAIEKDMRGQERWRFPPRFEGEELYYATSTILHVDVAYCSHVLHERKRLMMQGRVWRPSEVEIRDAKRFLEGMGLAGEWVG